MIIVGLGIAGFCGAVARYWLGAYITRNAGSAFPWGTFVINITGALVLGFLAGVGMGGSLIPAAWRTVVGTGFLGGYTTFSTFNLETFRLLEDRKFLLAGMNLGLSTVAGLLAAGAGIFVGRQF